MQGSTALLPARTPPGPRGLPVLGALPFLFRAPTHHSLNRLAGQYGDVCLFHIGNVPTVVISHPRVLAEAFDRTDTWDASIARHGLPERGDTQLFGPTDEDRGPHLRRFAAEKLFGPEARRMVERNHIAPLVDELAQRLEHLAEAGKTARPLMDLEGLDYSLTFRVVFGGSSHDSLDFLTLKSQLRELVTWGKAAAGLLLPSDFFSWLKGYTKKLEREAVLLQPALEKVVAGLIEGVRRRPESDPTRPTCLAEVLLASQAAGDLDWAEVRSLCSDLLAAGPANLGKTLSWFLLLVANRPEVQSGIHEELDRVLGRGALPATEDRARLPFTSACLSEAMRYRTVQPLSPPRRTARATEIGGYHIPAGAQVLGNIHAIHHDDRFWMSPLRFLPERFLPGPDGAPPAGVATGAFLPFGPGLGPSDGHDLADSAAWLHAAGLLSRLKFETPEETPLPEVEVYDRTIMPRPYALKPVRRW